MAEYPGFTNPTGTAPSSNLEDVKGAYEPFPKKGQVTAGDIDTEGASDGQQLTSDGSGNAAWETA